MLRAPGETGGDRVTLAQDAGLGRVSLLSVLAGTLVSYGAFVVLLALTAAVAGVVSSETDVTNPDWRTVGTAAAVVIALVLLLSYLFGGYVAGRMARRAGALNGLLVFVLSLLIAIGVSVLVNALADVNEEAALGNLRNTGVPTSADEWKDVGTVGGIGSLVAMLLGAVAGGFLGERWHGKLVRRALDPSVGPEADARAAASAAEDRRLAEEQRQAEERRRADDQRQADERARTGYTGQAPVGGPVTQPVEAPAQQSEPTGPAPRRRTPAKRSTTRRTPPSS